jgi:hypothetical protein
MINTRLIGQVFLFATIQSIIGSVEMSNKFCLISVTKDQETLQNAAYALSDYLKIALLWTIGTALIGYSNLKEEQFKFR